MKKLGILIIVIIVAIVVLFLLRKDTEAPTLSNRNEPQATSPVSPSSVKKENKESDTQNTQIIEYVCDEGREVVLTLSGPEYRNAKVNFGDSSASLTHVVSASGSRYTNGNESIVFWSQGNEAFIEQNGKTTYENCIQK